MDSNEIDTKKIREEYNLSQQELADKTGIPKGRINAWERRGTIPKMEDYLKIKAFVDSNKSSQKKKSISNGVVLTNLTIMEIPLIPIHARAGYLTWLS